MYICMEIKEKVQSLLMEQNKYVFKQDLNDDNDGAHRTSFGIELQTEEKENERSPRVDLLFAGILRRSIKYELERVCDGFISSMSGTCCEVLRQW